MKAIRVLTGVAIMALTSVQVARADFKDFSNRCTPGAFRSCASLQVITTANASGGTDVVIRVRNLAGSGFAYHNAGGSLITRIGLITPDVTGAANLAVNAVGGASAVGSASAPWFLRSPGGLGGLIELTATLAPGSFSGGIAGCVPSYSGYQAVRFETCGANAWVEFTFTTSNSWSANQAEVAWLLQDVENPAGYAEECGSNPGSGHRSFCAVTPEPVTMVLLGSGLAGMGGFGVLRRRKKNDVENV